MKILVLNCGSSSIKYQLLDMITATNYSLSASGIVERIGIEDAKIKHKTVDGRKLEKVENIPNHKVGIRLVLEILESVDYGVIRSKSEINAVGHRVAHGGENFKDSILINEVVEKDIEMCIELAPLHNPANLEGIRSVRELLPNVPQVAVFDTSFHQTISENFYLYGLPYKYYADYKVRKYGFHGTSHKYVMEEACKFLGVDVESQKIISCHLGNGASICAINKGKSAEISMGFTPASGLIMGTRAGKMDLGALLFIAKKEDLSMQECNDLINKKSGVLGISGVSSDMRDLENEAAKGNKRARLALDMYAHRIRHYIGAYAAVLNGVDILIFTGGIGENADTTRREVAMNLEYLGLEFDDAKNTGVRGELKIISKDNSKVKCLIVPTNEELVIAKDTLRIVNSI